jgi:ribosomal protein L40E
MTIRCIRCIKCGIKNEEKSDDCKKCRTFDLNLKSHNRLEFQKDKNFFPPELQGHERS